MINSLIPVAAVVTTTAAPNRAGGTAVAERVRQEMPVGGKTPPVDAHVSDTWQQARQAADVLARYLTDLSNELQFRVDDATGNSVVTVYNSETDSVVRQVPSEEVLAVARYLQDQIDQQRPQPLLNSNDE
ncbi:flagellar protein FlaG [Pseudohalioglobus lutimaris]|uniref:Flagellar biosynthesis protein FlaG n=1 Tax=Pseudohalioglobus lutimaris TaxID=1737061 RepID=A0A2N5X1B9_9GAMM|nr:flagellar protein FlaG [Pseudohalioglobus lutimaris]PLW68286.1 hypothetical protein C0039_12880 [Pseudohalioglobus lutimaris]